MAGIKKKKSSGGGANWMDTYGDMVTLLLCFFVLLYSISTIDAEKWMIVVKSFNRDAIITDPDVPPGPTSNGSAGSGGDKQPATDIVEHDLDELYQFLAEYIQNEQNAGDVSVSRGDNYVFISFGESVFFAPDSPVLRDDGKLVLDAIIPAVAKAGPSVDELRVYGHTAQAAIDKPNRPLTDYTLSSSRASAVVAYLQENIPSDDLMRGRYLAIGSGQWRNVSSNDTEAGKARNRRVELVITGRNLGDALSDSYQQYYTMYESTNGTKVSN